MTVRTANGRTNRPIARLSPWGSLEVSADERSSNVNTEESAQIGSTSDDESSQQRPARRAMFRARQKLAEWTKMLCSPPEDVENND